MNENILTTHRFNVNEMVRQNRRYKPYNKRL